MELCSESELSMDDMDVDHKEGIKWVFRGSCITFLGWCQGY